MRIGEFEVDRKRQTASWGKVVVIFEGLAAGSDFAPVITYIRNFDQWPGSEIELREQAMAAAKVAISQS